MANLGFIGLGAMGGRIAKRLLDAGHAVTGYNRTKSRAQWLLDAGMNWADSPREIAESCDSNRLLDNGYRQRVAPVPYRPYFSVDSPADRDLVESAMRDDPLWGTY